MFFILITILIILCVLEYFLNYNGTATIFKRIPGNQVRFIIGNTLDFIYSPVELFSLLRYWAQKYNGIYRFYMFSFGVINIYTPDDIEIVTSSMKHNEKSIVYTLLRPWLRDGLLLSKGTKWQNRRKVLTSAFHFNVLRQYFINLEENNQRFVQTLEKTNEEIHDIVPLISEFTLNSLCESAMGTKLNKEGTNTGMSYKEAIYAIGKILVHRLVRLYLYPNFIFNLTPSGKRHSKSLSTIHSFTAKVIKDRKEAVKNNEVQCDELEDDPQHINFNINKKKIAMLDLLIAAEKEGSIDKMGIQEEVDTFMFEGHDTTSSSLTYCLLSIANNPHVQKKIAIDLREIFGETKRSTTMDDLNKMQYLERCIKESMRLYPPVPFISRVISETVQLSNYTVPAGTVCHIHIYDLHRRADLYENPLLFDPDRFLPENCKDRHNFAYIPFSAGPRNCIGQRFAMLEMKSALCAILRNFELHPVTKISDLKFAADLVLRNSGPVYIKFVQRKDRI
ncbi:cytochrome P450 4C1-like isoform X1 [Epargyreus clarus]|uniref:cytochrome P450 4C1-like isoform X1 n=2 Tax=Epargyreus clarus TaxID=520877 RepID=UPI003C2F0168